MDITPCRDGLEATRVNDQVQINGRGYHFDVSAEPSGSGDCPCGGHLQVADLGYVRLYGCATCGARLSLWISGTPATLEVQGMNAEEVSRVLKDFFSQRWDESQEYADEATLEDFGGEVKETDGKSKAVRRLMVHVCRVKGLSENERHELMKVLVAVVAEGPRTGGAIATLKSYLPKLGQDTLKAITLILVDVVSAAMRMQLGI